MSIAFELAVIAGLVLLNGCFAMSELAIVSARRARLAPLAAAGDRRARAALALAEDPVRFLSAVQIGITLVGIFAGAYSGASLGGHLAGAIAAALPWLAPVADGLSLALVVGAITYASLILGELVPKQIALSAPERVAMLVARPMAGVARLASPVVWLLERSSKAALTLLRVNPAADAAVTEEEVRSVIAEGAASGALQPREGELLAGVLRLGDRKVRGVMTPRAEIAWIDLAWEPERIAATLRESRHSRLVACREGLDNVEGVVQAKDLLDVCLGGGELDVAALVRPVTVVPEHAPALSALDELRRARIHMALVADEYGTIEGLVTAADLMAAIVGTLAEAGGEPEAAAVMRADGSWLVDADMPADLAAERLGCRPLAAGGDYETLAGFLLGRSGTLPRTGDVIAVEGWRFEVVDMDGLRIDKVLVTPPSS